MSEKQYESEWSFSFDKLGEKIREMVEPLDEAELKTESFAEAINGAESATINLGMGISETTVSALAASDNLFEADITAVGDLVFTVDGEAQRVITLKHKEGFNGRMIAGAGRNKIKWDIRLTPDVPLNLNVSGGVGQATLDLSGLMLSDVNVKTGIGATEIMLPPMAKGTEVNLKSGVGELVVHVNEETAADITIKGGVGSVVVHVPPTAAVRVRGRVGMGSIETPANFKQRKGGRKFVSQEGIWETDGFEDADHQVNITYKGGVGALEINNGEHKDGEKKKRSVEIV